MDRIRAEQEPVSVLVFAASLRAGSLNARLAALVRTVLAGHGAAVDSADMSDFDSPSYHGDVEGKEGLPPGARELTRRLQANDAFVIVSPEYNGSMPGYLKNVIDWVSRVRPQPFNTRHALLLSASPSMAGGNRGLWSLRMPLEHLGARVFPDMFSLAQADKALDAGGQIADEKLRARFDQNLAAFLELVEAAKRYPCMKKAWVEFLGEPAGSADRVDAD
ncbi:MAG TPA: NAD(P)H-dependent oxidoreductase [Polyangia bacterium]|nr:NAD(P)H-dependent oxidoreductase [Polyangia bacterium]